MGMNKNTLLVGSLGLIILAIGMVAILDKTTQSKSASTDVRARAATTKNLMIDGVVQSVNEVNNTLIVERVIFADTSRSGPAKDMGTWIVTPPASFSIASISPGAKVLIGVDAKTFLASKRTMTAMTIVQMK